MTKIAMLYITTGSQAEAEKLSRLLLEARLIACSNMYPIHSAYWWKQKITHDKEWVIIAKTIASHWENVQKLVRDNHSYDIPCISKLEIESNPEYAEWVYSQCAKL